MITTKSIKSDGRIPLEILINYLLTGMLPQANSETNTWWIYDSDSHSYINSETSCFGSVGFILSSINKISAEESKDTYQINYSDGTFSYFYVLNSYGNGSGSGSGGDITIDSALSTISTNPVQNKVITNKINSISNVAWSGNYNDLLNKPSIPTKTSDLQNDLNFISVETDPTVPSWAKQNTKPTYDYSEILNKPNVAIIDDSTYTNTKTWSSQKIKNEISSMEITVDSALSSTSENPVQNKVITEAIGDISSLLNLINGEII